MEEIHSLNKYKRFTHVLQEEINNIFKILKDYTHHIKILDFLKSELEFFQGNNTFDVGNIFKVTYNSYLYLTFTCLESTNDENFKKISWKVNEPKTNINFTYTYNLYMSTLDYSTVLECEIDYSENQKISKPILDLFDIAKLDFFKRLENYLNSSIFNIQIETVLIPAGRDVVWEVVTDWTEFQRRVPLIADKVIYETEEKTLGSTLIIQKGAMYECKLKVVLVENDPDSFIWEFGLDSMKTLTNIPEQHICLQIERLEKELTLVTFKHEFKQNISAKLLNALSKEKKKILRLLKSSFS